MSIQRRSHCDNLHLYSASATMSGVYEIPNGTADIARYLGLKPEKTIWDYGAVFSPESGQQFSDPTIGAAHMGITSLVKGDTRGLVLETPQDFLSYQQQYLGVSKHVHALRHEPRSGNEYHYPHDSLAINAARTNNLDLQDSFKGATWCPLIAVPETERAAAALGARTLITSQQAADFNSKVRVVTEAQAEGYNVAPHVVASSWSELEPKMRELRGKAEGLGLDPNETKYWVKFDNLAGGMGVRPYRPQEEKFGAVRDWIRDGINGAGMGENAFMPVVMDIDIGHLPQVKRVLNNLNVQAIVGPSGVAMTGTTFQKTKDGKYIGGALPLNDEEHEHAREARKWAKPVLEAAQRKGYRGYAGIDVILCEGHNGENIGFILEMNGRLNSSTSLLAGAHYVKRESGIAVPAAFNLSSSFAGPTNMQTYLSTLDKHGALYKGAESGFEGVFPIIMKPSPHGGIGGDKTVAVAASPESLAGLEKRYHKAVAALT